MAGRDSRGYARPRTARQTSPGVERRGHHGAPGRCKPWPDGARQTRHGTEAVGVSARGWARHGRLGVVGSSVVRSACLGQARQTGCGAETPGDARQGAAARAEAGQEEQTWRIALGKARRRGVRQLASRTERQTRRGHDGQTRRRMARQARSGLTVLGRLGSASRRRRGPEVPFRQSTHSKLRHGRRGWARLVVGVGQGTADVARHHVSARCGAAHGGARYARQTRHRGSGRVLVRHGRHGSKRARPAQRRPP